MKMTNLEEKYFQTYQKTLKDQLPQKHKLRNILETLIVRDIIKGL